MILPLTLVAPAAISLPARQLQLHIMVLWHLIVQYDLWVVQFGGIAAGSIVMDVECHALEGGGIDNICNVVEAPLSYGYTASYKLN